MNVIHLLSQNHLTGAEVYAVTLANEQIKAGHRAYQLSNGFFYPSKAVQMKLEVESRSRLKFIQNVLWLRNFIRRDNIHVIHCHSRAASKLAWWATLFSKTAQVSSVHGVQHASFSKKLHNQYGRFIIAVCDNVKRQLIRDFNYEENLIRVIPNPVAGEDYRFIPSLSSGYKKIAVVGRTTGPKGTRSEQVIRELLKSPGFEVHLVGGSLKDLKVDSSRVKEVSAPRLNSDIYAQYDLIIGSGRVAMEALITGVPVIAFGEACYVGLVTPENFALALTSNFGDIHPESKEPRLDTERFALDLAAPRPDLKKLSETATHEFSLSSITKRIERLYESAYFLQNYSKWIPVLMYHKIPKTEIQSQHKIFVTEGNFEKHLRFFKKKGFETLTFSQLSEFRKGLRSFDEFPKKPLVLTFDDGYRDNFENASPLLKKYGFRAQLFLLANSDLNHNSWDVGSTEPAHEILAGTERQKWLQSAFEIGSHGFSHRKITEMSSEEALRELVDSKASLEKEFGVPMQSFAFTYGITSYEAAELAEKAGYPYALNTDTGGMRMEENPYSIFRVNIFPDESPWSLLKKTSGLYRKYYRFKRKK